MDSSRTPSPSEEVTDIYSLSDQVISEQLEFVEEIGNGNWGSVWLCRPKHLSKSSSDHTAFRNAGHKFAVKLVHRKKTSANASRVKSLWNEMKVVRGFKNDPHPSIIPFHSFIITPSFAMITMTYLPILIPVEVEESKAREWFRFLLSGVDFLHKRGVVHNDIKPANILLSHKNIPVFVDFGFAEQNDPELDTSFHSNLAYGTPEYLSPERARGLPHDTRKSDVWSLGVTFFEILTGRTPFEEYDGEALQTKEDVERYWSRTLRGKWVGKWDFSKGMERFLRRMMSPNADLRCTATQSIADPYWNPQKEAAATSHRRSSSYNSSIIFEKDVDKLLNMMPSSRRMEQGPISPPGLGIPTNLDAPRHSLAKSKSQPKVVASKIHPRRRPPVVDLSPIKASPPASPFASASAKENIASINTYAKKEVTGTRRAFGAISPSVNTNTTLSRLPIKPLDELKRNRRSRVFGDLRKSHSNLANESDKGKQKASTNVKDRMMEWEREKQRLREMERLEELEKERDDHFERERQTKKMKEKINTKTKTRKSETTEERKSANPEKDHDSDKENLDTCPASPPMLPLPPAMSPLTQVLNTLPAPTPMNTPAQQPTKRSKQNRFRHSIKASIDKTMHFYKSSSISRATGGSTPARGISIDIVREAENMKNGRESKEDTRKPEEVVSPVSAALSPLPAIKNAAMNELIAAESHMDRMTIWMRNVEKVVEEAQANFAASAPMEASLPPLPVPLSRSQSRANRSSRLPRRVLAASQIFDENGHSPVDQSFASNQPSSYSGLDTSNLASSTNGAPSNVVSPTESQFLIPEIHTPSRQRRATVSTRSPEPLVSPRIDQSYEGQGHVPHQVRDKSKSHANLFELRIAPLSLLEANLHKASIPEPSPRLSEVLDRNLFIAPPLTSRDDLLDNSSFVVTREPSYDDLTSSPCHVEPYPLRHRPSQDIPIPDTPDRHRIENVYDRFLMATSGVKRNGKGYMSDNCGAVSNGIGLAVPSKRDSHRAFYSSRRPMPPPVSSEDQRRTVSVDELGIITHNEGEEGSTPIYKDDANTTVALVRRAFKAIVPGKAAAASRRLSRIY